jgi:hypothetical protein
MAVFTNHTVRLPELLRLIPEELFSALSAETGVDYHAKVLHGKTLFYLLLYALMTSDGLSRRGS